MVRRRSSSTETTAAGKWLRQASAKRSAAASGGIEGGSVPRRVKVRHDLGGLVLGELRPDVGQAMEPTADAHRAGNDGLDEARGVVGGDRRRGPEEPGDHVAQVLGPGGLGLVVADGQAHKVLSAVGVDAPGDEQGLLGPLGPERLEDRVQGQLLGFDAGEVPGKKAW